MSTNMNPAHSMRHDVPVLLTINDVASVLRVSRRTAEYLISSGQLRSVPIGRSRRVTQDDLREFASRGTAEIVKAGLRAVADSTGK